MDTQSNSEALPPTAGSLSRWPTVEEVRANYLTPGTGWAYAVITGFRDYQPVVAKFYVVTPRPDDAEVWVDFPSGPAHAIAKRLAWDDGQTLRFLCVANAKEHTTPRNEA